MPQRHYLVPYCVINESALTDVTGGALPALYALLVAVMVADIMAELVVPRPAEFRAGGVVIMRVAFHSHPVGETGLRPPVV